MPANNSYNVSKNVNMANLKQSIERVNDSFMNAIGLANDIPACIEAILQGRFPEGKELTESWQSLHNRIILGNFQGIHIGDYKEITLTTGEEVVMEVAGIDTYRKGCKKEVIHHIDFISRDCLFEAHRMNQTDTNVGTDDIKWPWLSSEMYSTLNDETNGIYSTLPDNLKPYIIEKNARYEQHYFSEDLQNTYKGFDWIDIGKLWLPTEVEIFGHTCCSNIKCGSGGGCNMRYPIFEFSTDHIIKGKGKNGSDTTYYISNIADSNTTSFCYVDHHGSVDGWYNASRALNIPLCFRIA